MISRPSGRSYKALGNLHSSDNFEPNLNKFGYSIMNTFFSCALKSMILLSFFPEFPFQGAHKGINYLIDSWYQFMTNLISFAFSNFCIQKFIHCQKVCNLEYTANFCPIKTTGTGNCGVPAEKTCTIYGRGPVIIIGFPHNSYSPFP